MRPPFPHPTSEADTVDERGIVASADLARSASQPLLSVPSALLITPERVLSSASILALLPRASLAQLTCEQQLILYLVLHRRLGEASPAYPYLDLLPSSYSSLEWWNEAELRLLRRAPPAQGQDTALPVSVSEEDDPQQYHHEQCSRIRRECAQLNALLAAHHPQLQRCRFDDGGVPASPVSLPLSLLQPTLPSDHAQCRCSQAPLPCFRCQVSLAEYQWAHSTVASRSCYWPTTSEAASTSPSPAVSCCLIPFLDLLNHSSFVTAACAYNASSRLYHLTVRDRHPAMKGGGDDGLRVKAGEEVFISYGELSNWQLLTRYGFVLADNQDERVDLPLANIEAFISRHCRVQKRRGPRLPSSPPAAPNMAGEATLSSETEPSSVPSAAPVIRCCCTRTVLPSRLTEQLPPVGVAALTPLPAMSEKHSALLALLGVYDLPQSFALSCCQPRWLLLTFIKARTAFSGVDGGEGVGREQLQRMAAAMGDEGGENRGWVDAEHERRGRRLLIALARWMEERLGGEPRSLAAEVKEAVWLQRNRTAVEAESAATGLSWLSRVLSIQFRVSRRRMLLGFIHQQELAIQTLH